MIELEVIGLPAPQGSATAMLIGNRAVLVPGTSKEGRKATKVWRKAVTAAAMDHLAVYPVAPLDEPIAVWITFRFPPVPSEPFRTRMTTTPDIDKLLRSTFDALTDSGLIVNDSRIWRVSATKLYVKGNQRPGATISLEVSGEEEKELSQIRKAATRVR
jgi:Holliday junction resolvase RusA-like endonuclease